MSFHDWVNDADDFYPFQGDALPMIAASAAQNTPDYFDQDNFYPADGIVQNVKDYLSPAERAKRKELRQGKKTAKTQEIQSRAELNKGLAQDKPSDVELAKALGSGDTSTSKTSETMSKNTKIAIGVGVALVLGVVVYFVMKKKK